jgi:hypothetical protein
MGTGFSSVYSDDPHHRGHHMWEGDENCIERLTGRQVEGVGKVDKEVGRKEEHPSL